jgi:hypothetical protein
VRPLLFAAPPTGPPSADRAVDPQFVTHKGRSRKSLIAKWLALNPNQRAFAAKDQSWWLEGLRSDPRYQALVKSSN